MGKYDGTQKTDIKIVERVHEIAQKYSVAMSEIAIAWLWVKGVASPIIGATKTKYIDDAVNALNVKLTADDMAYLDAWYLPHKIVGAIDKNPEQGVILLDEKK